jgi:hypothetical protein
MTESVKRYKAESGELYSSGDYCTDTEIFNTRDEALRWLYESHVDICNGCSDLKNKIMSKMVK